ncbi:hypothetical protein [Streptomyces sp. FL07-04A]|uniref:hypothetical protein n=1 Tax=Streptomyces sp. FL07-04A TaxID=3028658 RepID=UPI0029A75B23|nr:hypothetical protein [Streptomyces sp. FL07-04A]MDX3578638.1 hypothetical protein [Streptomyces sp. FL07-04A]
MLNLLMTPRTARKVRGLIGAIADAVRSVINPAALVADQAEPAPVEATDPAGLYEPDEIPAVATIEQAAREYDRAADQARRADRAKRASKKILDRLPAGVYGMYRVFRTPSSRQTPDLAEITRIFKAHNLGPVPMKACAASLKVELVDVAPVDTKVLAGVTV